MWKRVPGPVRSAIPLFLVILVPALFFFFIFVHFFEAITAGFFSFFTSFILNVLLNPQALPLLNWMQNHTKFLRRLTPVGIQHWLNFNHYSILYFDNPDEGYILDNIRRIEIETELKKKYECDIQPVPWDGRNTFSEALLKAKRGRHLLVIISGVFLTKIQAVDKKMLLQLARKEDESINSNSGSHHDSNIPKAILIIDSRLNNSRLQDLKELTDSTAFMFYYNQERFGDSLYMIPTYHCQPKSQPSGNSIDNATTTAMDSGTSNAPGTPPQQAQQAPPLPHINQRVKMNIGHENKFFLDRERNHILSLAVLESRLRNDSILILWGMNGSGKTQIARAFAYKYFLPEQSDTNDPRPYPCILWLEASRTLSNGSKNGLKDGLETLNKQLETITLESGQAIPPTIGGLEELGKLGAWLNAYQTTPEKRWLLVIDACERSDFERYHHLFARLTGERPSRGNIIFTMYEAPSNNPGGLVKVSRLTIPEGTKLLMRVAYNDERLEEDGLAGIAPQTYWQNATQVVEKLDGNPMAIVAAGSLMGKAVTPGQYIEYYDKSHRRILFERQHFDGNQTLPLPIAAVWDVTLNKIKGLNLAYQLLLLCAFLPFEPIPLKVIFFIPGDKNTHPFLENNELRTETLQRLQSFTVLSTETILIDPDIKDEDSSYVRVNKIVRENIDYRRLDNALGHIDVNEQKATKIRAIRAVGRSLPDKTNANWPKVFVLYLPHLRKCVEYIQEFLPYKASEQDLRQLAISLSDQAGSDIIRLLYIAGLYLFENPHQEAKPGEAKRLLKYAWKLDQSISNQAMPSSSGSPDSVSCSLALAKLYYEEARHNNENKLRKAQGLFSKTRDTIRHLYSDLAHNNYLDSCCSLGLACMDLGDNDSADDCFGEAENIRERLWQQVQGREQGEERLWLILIQAEILKNKAVIAMRRGDSNKRRAQRHNADEYYKVAKELLNTALDHLDDATRLAGELPETVRRDNHKKIVTVRRECLLTQDALFACWHAKRTGHMRQKMIDVYEAAINADKEGLEMFIIVGQNVPAENFMRLITRLNNLAGLLQKQEKAPYPKAQKKYLEALTIQYDRFHRTYFKDTNELQPIGRVVRANLISLTRRGFTSEEDKISFDEFNKRYR